MNDRAEFEYRISTGTEGVRETLYIMRKIVREYKHSRFVVELARSITRHVAPKDWAGEVRAVFDWVQSNIRYAMDPSGVETLTTPDALVEMGAGDCDDMSVLVASLLEALNHPTRFRAVGFHGGELSHVFVETKIGPNWIALDTSEPQPLGWTPPREEIRNNYILKN